MMKLIFKRTLSLALVTGTILASMSMLTFASDNKKIKNVIMMIPDGMSVTGTTLARYMLSGNTQGDTDLALDQYVTALVKTNWAYGPITDSAPAGTAYATGEKSISGVLGLDANKLPRASLLEAAQTKGKATGLVMTCEYMHATPAAYSAHEEKRSNYTIVAEQMLNQKLDVMLGTGSTKIKTTDLDSRAIAQTKGYTLLNNRQEMLSTNSKKIWGDFSAIIGGKNNMAYDMDRDVNTEPSIEEMTKKAIDVLNQNPKGFFLMVEGSKIDWAAHANDTVGIVSDVLAYDKAFKAAVDFAKKDGNTLVVSVTDHGNSGITIGSNASATYDKDLFSMLEPLRGAKKTAEGAMTLVDSAKSEASLNAALVAYGIDPADTKIATEIAAFKATPSIATIVKTMNKKAIIGYSTSGHTGEDVPLYVYAPEGYDIPTGLIENTDVAKYIASAIGVDLDKTTSNLFVDVTSQINSKDDTTKTYTLFLNGKTVILKPNQSTAKVDNKVVDLNGQVIVLANSKLYVPQELMYEVASTPLVSIKEVQATQSTYDINKVEYVVYGKNLKDTLSLPMAFNISSNLEFESIEKIDDNALSVDTKVDNGVRQAIITYTQDSATNEEKALFKLSFNIISGSNVGETMSVSISQVSNNASVKSSEAATIISKSSKYDLDGDGKCTKADLDIVLKNYQSNIDDADWSTTKIADVNVDCRVDLQDIMDTLVNVKWL